jgi:hypothetical protein
MLGLYASTVFVSVMGGVMFTVSDRTFIIKLAVFLDLCCGLSRIWHSCYFMLAYVWF